MKKLFIIILLITVFASCIPELDIPTLSEPPIGSESITYEGYPLYTLLLNESGNYLIWYQVTTTGFQVDNNVSPANVIIERGKTQNIVFKQMRNGQHTGKYIIYLTNDYVINNFYN